FNVQLAAFTPHELRLRLPRSRGLNHTQVCEREKHMRFAVLISMIVLLAECSTQRQASEAAAKKAELAAKQDLADDAECRVYGLATDPYKRCRQVLLRGRVDDDSPVK